MKADKQLTAKYEEGVNSFVETLKEQFDVDLTEHPPVWNTIHGKVVKVMESHRAKRNKKDKTTGDGEREDEGLSPEEQQASDEKEDLYDNLLAMYEGFKEFESLSKAARTKKLKYMQESLSCHMHLYQKVYRL